MSLGQCPCNLIIISHHQVYQTRQHCYCTIQNNQLDLSRDLPRLSTYGSIYSPWWRYCLFFIAVLKTISIRFSIVNVGFSKFTYARLNTSINACVKSCMKGIGFDFTKVWFIALTCSQIYRRLTSFDPGKLKYTPCRVRCMLGYKLWYKFKI